MDHRYSILETILSLALPLTLCLLMSVVGFLLEFSDGGSTSNYCPHPPRTVRPIVNFSLDSDHLEVITADNIARLELLATVDPNGNLERRNIVFSPDRRYIAVGAEYVSESPSHDCSDLWIWDLTTGHIRILRTNGAATGRYMQFIPGSDFLLTQGVPRQWGYPDFLWNVETGVVWKQFYRASLKRFPDRYLISYTNTIRVESRNLWDAETGNIVTEEYSGTSQARSFSPDNKVFFTAEVGEAVQIVDTETLEQVAELPACRESEYEMFLFSPSYIEISPDGQWLVVGCTHEIELWNLETYAFHFAIERLPIGHCLEGMSEFTHDSTRYGKSCLGMWNIESGELLIDFRGSAFYGFCPDNTFLVTISEQGTNFLDTSSGEHLTPGVNTVGTTNIDFSLDGTLIAAVVNGHVELWGIPTGD